MNVRELVAANLRRIRSERGMSQEELANSAGVNRTYVSDIERCVYSISVDKLAVLASVLNVQPYELLLPTTEG